MNPRLRSLALIFAATSVLSAVEGEPRRGPRQPETGSVVFRTEVPAYAHDIVLGRPTDVSITLSLLAYRDTEARISVWNEADASNPRQRRLDARAGEPAVLLLDALRPATAYRYRVDFARPADGSAPAPPAEGGFHTARPRGSAFTFAITADSHLDENTDPALYLRTLGAAAARRPDFLVDLGDTFMTEKRPRPADALPQYLAQRYYFERIASSCPLFLVLGNHDGEGGRHDDGTAGSRAVWSALTRKRYFPNPEPGPFYSGNATPHAQAGLLQDYYAWEWGDALFVVLDPFWPTPRVRRGDDNWKMTLGKAQYDWLERTLAGSGARWKFVFIHHLVGGLDRQARGGVEASRLYEWGGGDPVGGKTFAEMRPGWPEPIHDLLARHGVSAVFHGHDHLFAEQTRDGVLYQEVPQPGHPRGGANRAADYGYKEGVILDGSGFLAVTVAPDSARVDFVDCIRGANVARSISLPPPRN